MTDKDYSLDAPTINMSFELIDNQMQCLVTVHMRHYPGETRVLLREIIEDPFWQAQLSPKHLQILRHLYQYLFSGT